MTGHRSLRSLLIFIGGVATVSLAGCSKDSAAPSSDVTVTITITQLDGPSISEIALGDQRVNRGGAHPDE